MGSVVSATPLMPRTVDLYGRGGNGRPKLWRRAVQVMPTSVFERNGRWINSGHYVIDHCGDAVVVHCGNIAAGLVSVQFVLDELLVYEVALSTIEPMLLGMVIASKDQQAAVSEGMRLSDLFGNGKVSGSSLLSHWRSSSSKMDDDQPKAEKQVE
jgi:hypothetical protein